MQIAGQTCSGETISENGSVGKGPVDILGVRSLRGREMGVHQGWAVVVVAAAVVVVVVVVAAGGVVVVVVAAGVVAVAVAADEEKIRETSNDLKQLGSI